MDYVFTNDLFNRTSLSSDLSVTVRRGTIASVGVAVRRGRTLSFLFFNYFSSLPLHTYERISLSLQPRVTVARGITLGDALRRGPVEGVALRRGTIISLLFLFSS